MFVLKYLQEKIRNHAEKSTPAEPSSPTRSIQLAVETRADAFIRTIKNDPAKFKIVLAQATAYSHLFLDDNFMISLKKANKHLFVATILARFNELRDRHNNVIGNIYQYYVSLFDGIYYEKFEQDKRYDEKLKLVFNFLSISFFNDIQCWVAELIEEENVDHDFLVRSFYDDPEFIKKINSNNIINDAVS